MGAKEFTHQYTLMRHLPTHTDERKFQCNTCGKGNLRNHIFTHTNERPYKCDICSKGFNQMSNLMCHKLKAHQRTEKPKYVCQICGQSFPKRIGLRHHEQYTHGMITENIATPQIPEKLNLMNAIIVDPIKTEAMRLALESSQTPFALLRPLSGIPVLVRVLPAGEKQMLVPASAEDLKKHSHISITSKAERENIEPKNGKPVGSTVQIKIPVVATVIQQNDQGGQMSMSVLSPGPNGEFVEQPEMNKAFDNTNFNNFVYTSTLTLGNGATSTGMVDNDTPLIPKSINPSDFIKDIAIEFLDEQGIRLAHKENIKDAAVEEVIAGESTSQENCVEAIDINSSISDDTVVEMEIENNLF